jgi:PAS domain S-box-containing protein
VSEQAFFATGIVFVVVLAASMVRLAPREGGGAWAATWVCLYLSGAAVLLSERWPLIGPLIPLLGTSFALLFWVGSRQFSGRQVPRWVLAAAGAVAAARVGIEPLVSEASTLVAGSGLIALSAGASAWEVARQARRPAARRSELLLALSFSLVALASCTYTWLKIGGQVPSGFFLWLATGVLVAGAQTTNLLGRVAATAERRRATLSAVFDSAPIGLLLIDGEGAVRVMNPVLADLVGDEPAEAWAQRPVAALLDRLEEQPEDPASPLLQSIGTLYAPEAVVETRAPGGRRLQIHGRPISSEGRAVGRVVLVRDVTREREMQEQLERTSRLETLGRLAGGIAHDFNNKLTTVLGNAAMLRDELPGKADGLPELVDLEEAAQYCADLTRDLLDFARQGPRSEGSVDLEKFLAAFAASWRGRLGAGISLTLDIDPAVGRLAVEEAQLRRVLVQLVENAREAVHPHGEITLAARHSSLGNESWVELSVADDGVGISEEARQSIFDPFFTTKDLRGASGLGLAIVHGIVTAHNGTIRVESTPEKGTRIVTRWPAVH